jgi:hypothetical protein
MGGGRRPGAVELQDGDRAIVEAWSRRSKTWLESLP